MPLNQPTLSWPFIAILASLLSLPFSEAVGSEIVNVPELGLHHRILTIEKNENPQNLVLMYTRLDRQCRFVMDDKQGQIPFLDFYWLNDRSRYHEMHALLKRGIRKRLEVQPLSREPNQEGAFAIRIRNLREIRHDLDDPVMLIKAVGKPGADGNNRCEVQAQMKVNVGKSESMVRLEAISAVGKKTFLPPFRKVVSVTLHGVIPKNGERVERTFSAPGH
jgi:hypothetical protein